MTTDSPEGLLREIAERDPEAHNRALARGYGCGVDSSDTAIGSPAFKAAKEAAQARGWVMEPSVISGMLAAAFGSLLERLDQLEHRLYPSQGENFDNEVERRGYVIETMQGAIAELRAEQCRTEQNRRRTNEEGWLSRVNLSPDVSPATTDKINPPLVVEALQTGWICPACGAGVAPWRVAHCEKRAPEKSLRERVS